VSMLLSVAVMALACDGEPEPQANGNPVSVVDQPCKDEPSVRAGRHHPIVGADSLRVPRRARRGKPLTS